MPHVRTHTLHTFITEVVVEQRKYMQLFLEHWVLKWQSTTAGKTPHGDGQLWHEESGTSFMEAESA